jgi:hypothetical protein
MTRCLKLVKSNVTNVNFMWLGAYRLRVDVSDPANSGTDPNVFIYQRNLPNPYDGTTTDVWLGICSPVDMAEYPVGEPNPETAYPFYRMNWIEIDLRATSQAQESWLLIIQEVNNLLLAMDRLEQLVPTEEVTVGTCPANSESGASSISA